MQSRIWGQERVIVPLAVRVTHIRPDYIEWIPCEFSAPDHGAIGWLHTCACVCAFKLLLSLVLPSWWFSQITAQPGSNESTNHSKPSPTCILTSLASAFPSIS